MRLKRISKFEILAYSVLILSIIAEYLHLLFFDNGKPIYHSEKLIDGIVRIYYLDDMVYFFSNECLTFFLVLIAYSKIGIDKGSKAIMIGICFWYFIEFLEITLQLAKINDSRLLINDGSWLQLSTCLIIALLVLFSSKKPTS